MVYTPIAIFQLSVGNKIKDSYWNLRRKAVMYDVPENLFK